MYKKINVNKVLLKNIDHHQFLFKNIANLSFKCVRK